MSKSATLAQAIDRLKSVGDYIDPETRQTWRGTRHAPADIIRTCECWMMLWDPQQGYSLKYMVRTTDLGWPRREWDEYFSAGGKWGKIMAEKVMPALNLHTGNWRFDHLICWREKPGDPTSVKSLIRAEPCTNNQRR